MVRPCCRGFGFELDTSLLAFAGAARFALRAFLAAPPSATSFLWASRPNPSAEVAEADQFGLLRIGLGLAQRKLAAAKKCSLLESLTKMQTHAGEA